MTALIVNPTQEWHSLCMAATGTCQVQRSTQCWIRHELINYTRLFLVVSAFP